MSYFFYLTDEKANVISTVTTKFKRDKFKQFMSELEHSNIVILGLRQIGKSTLAKQLGKEYCNINNIKSKDSIYIDARSFSNLSSEKLLSDILQYYKNVKFFIIDEIQELDNWSNFVQVISDYRKDAKFIFTGSNSAMLSKNLPVGRASVLFLNPLNFKEYQSSWKDDSFERYLKFGSLPHNIHFTTPETQYPLIANNVVVDNVVTRDTKDRIDKEKFKRFFKKIINYIGNEFKITNIDPDSSLKIETKKKYLSVLFDSRLVQSISKYKDKNIRTKHKLYFNDKSMIYLFNDFNKLNSNEFGSLIENLIFNVLNNKYNKRYGFNDINYYRDKNDKEIDFILENEKLLIESKYITNKEKILSEIEKLEKAAKEMFKDYKKIIVTKNVKLEYKGWEAVPILDFLNMYR